MRRFLLASAVVAAVAGGVGAGPAMAYCQDKYRPLCLNDCMLTIDPQNPIKACPK